MRKLLSLLVLLLSLTLPLASQINCSPSGNLWVYANYDGGVLNIDVNVNVPNIKIGICTYEPTTINITGAFVGNVTEVRYAGYVSTNNFHCGNSPSTTTITGVNPGITSVNFLPPSTLSNPNGYGSIVCAYSCSTTSNQGGCNTADQIKDYFQTTMGGSLTSYFTQYGCWSTQPYQLSAGGNCCNTVLPCLIDADAGADQQMCPVGQSVTLTGSATGGATTYSWSPTTGLSNPNAAVTTAAPTVTTTYVLTATDGTVCADMDTVVVTVLQPTPPTLGPFQPVCVNAAPFALTSGSPGGGTYSGTGVSNGIFDPSAAGPGTTSINYMVVDGNGCSSSTNASISVQPLPQVSAGQIGPYCLNDPAATLSSGSPAGGSYSGTGVANGIFIPSAAGVGSHAITYIFTDSVGCIGSATTNAVVNANPSTPVLSFAAPNLSTPATGDSVQWFLNGSYLLTNGSSIVPSQNGSYTAVVWSNGCPSDTSAAVAVEIVGLADGLGSVVVTAWPNPAGDVLQVAVAGIQFEAVLTDALGRNVTSWHTIDRQGALSLRGLTPDRKSVV